MNKHTQIKEMLYQRFGYTSFREGQEEAILAALSGDNTLVMLPTGTGKSICYQLTGYCLDGIVLIVSPLLSLMQDQVEQMKMMGEKRVAAINSLMNKREKEWILNHLPQYKFIFLSPEMLQQKYVLNQLKQQEISLLAIDEAHCISQWGMDFRLDYLELGKSRKELGEPLTMALTATATEIVREEILTSLFLDKTKTKQILYSVDRPNIAYSTISCYQDKNEQLLNQINQLTKPGIIYFSSKKKADEVAGWLKSKTGFSVESYHSDIENDDKIKIQQQFIQNEIDIICATSAFGMGINKENIRFVIHYHLPASVEAYLQEVGRSGRDGKPSVAILLFEAGDQFLQLRLQEDGLPTSAMLEYAYRHKKIIEGSCSSTQKQIIENYLLSHVPLEEAKSQIMGRKIQKERQLDYMVHYAQTTECKRVHILHYFNESLMEKPFNCCSSCGLDEECFWSNQEEYLQSKMTKEKNWEKALTKLFLLTN
ncbi:RecQ family ATP-dependent DNA helicase [Carnobacterium mobile]|uniref:RecQ family ATP-dependent DNA helicase n=1 Tax=Carnobacterium mobile TaxID=2750 RepID=UPI00055197DF|nr:ATP-dependent DNA helicase RecQ [Carnobacterium mobile]